MESASTLLSSVINKMTVEMSLMNWTVQLTVITTWLVVVMLLKARITLISTVLWEAASGLLKVLKDTTFFSKSV